MLGLSKQPILASIQLLRACTTWLRGGGLSMCILRSPWEKTHLLIFLTKAMRTRKRKIGKNKKHWQSLLKMKKFNLIVLSCYYSSYVREQWHMFKTICVCVFEWAYVKSRIGTHESKSEPGFVGVVLRMFMCVWMYEYLFEWWQCSFSEWVSMIKSM